MKERFQSLDTEQKGVLNLFALAEGGYQVKGALREDFYALQPTQVERARASSVGLFEEHHVSSHEVSSPISGADSPPFPASPARLPASTMPLEIDVAVSGDAQPSPMFYSRKRRNSLGGPKTLPALFSGTISLSRTVSDGSLRERTRPIPNSPRIQKNSSLRYSFHSPVRGGVSVEDTDSSDEEGNDTAPHTQTAWGGGEEEGKHGNA
jgi:hypothetical protein